MKPIKDGQLERVHAIFYALVRERGWGDLIGLPPCISWVYLDASSTRVHARIEWPPSPAYGNPHIFIHPFAFEWNNEILLKGLVHHELCHYILGPEAGHNRSFKHLEEGWISYGDYREEVEEFARWVRRQSPMWRLECPACGSVSYRSKRPSEGAACAPCCRRFNKGEWSARFQLHIGGETTDGVTGTNPSD